MSVDLKELIRRNVEVFKNIEHTPPILDAIELTLILKAAGFRLESLDFSLPQKERNEAGHLKIDIQCHKSGIVSKLVYKPEPCSCPDAEAALNNSFWEVQASTPSSNKNIGAKLNEIHDASSNLLPDISAQAYEFSKLMLQLILTKFKLDPISKHIDVTPSLSPQSQNGITDSSNGVNNILIKVNSLDLGAISSSQRSSRESLITNLRDARASIEAGLNLLDQEESLHISDSDCSLPSLPIRMRVKPASPHLNGGTPRRHSISASTKPCENSHKKELPPRSNDKLKRTMPKLTPTKSVNSKPLPAKDGNKATIAVAALRVAAARKTLVPKPVNSKTSIRSANAHVASSSGNAASGSANTASSK